MVHTIQKDGTSIDCISFGRGSRPLVMLPGLSFQRVKGAAPALRYMYREFGKSHRVYVIDKKNEVPEGYTVRDMADDTAYAMERLGLSDADVLGVSQGGIIAQYLAIYYPKLVRRLALGGHGREGEPGDGGGRKRLDKDGRGRGLWRYCERYAPEDVLGGVYKEVRLAVPGGLQTDEAQGEGRPALYKPGKSLPDLQLIPGA